MGSPNCRILIVDDDAHVLAGIIRQFRADFEISTARTGAQALTLLDTVGPFAVVVTDQHMPGMDGLELLAKMRDRHPDTVRMMLTGSDDVELRLAAVDSNLVTRYLLKPCLPHVFGAALEYGLSEYALNSVGAAPREE